MNSDPLIEKNGTPDSPATARATNVLPVPGGPTKRTPRGTLPPRRRNRSGSRKKSTISCRSCFAAASPATSSKRTRTFSFISKRRGRLFRIPESGPPGAMR
jgi:hypothetical protein